jgi:hypothetical protein
MRMQFVGWDLDARRLRRRRWTPGAVILALVLGVIALAIAVTLLLMAVAGAIVIGGAYGGYRLLRATLWRESALPAAKRSRRISRETRGFIEMARTTDPLDRYLIAVREYDRLSGAVLEIDPADLGRGRAARRAADLAEQALNLHDAVAEIERQVAADPAADGAMTNVWELSVAAGEVWSYCRDLGEIRRTPTLMEVRALITRRTALLSRRDALVSRLRDAQLRRGASLPPPPSPIVPTDP